MILLGLFGLLLPTIDAKLAAGQGVLAVISAHAPIWVAIPFFVFVVLGEIWANYLDVYTAGLVTLAMGIRLERWQTALACGLFGTALAGYAVLVSDFHLAYEDFLILTYLWAPAWAAVVLLSFFVFDARARPVPALTLRRIDAYVASHHVDSRSAFLVKAAEETMRRETAEAAAA